MTESTVPAFDKIQILLVDDMPEGLPRPTSRHAPSVPVMASAYSQWFEFRWVATPQEACEYRDLSWLIAEHNPHLLAEEGWVPELLVLDYALTQDTHTVAEHVGGEEEWLNRLSPLPPLRRCARRLDSSAPIKRAAFDIEPAAGSEYWGCFIGGLVMNTFADHPCAPITITRYSQQTLKSQAVDAAFFEWLMETQSSGLLRAAGCAYSPSWQDIIRPGVASLRHRLLVLAKANIIHISLDDLLSLAENGKHPVLTVTSRYGRRRYPTAGLFVDAADKDRPSAASAWAHDLVEEAWSEAERPGTQNSFNEMLKDLSRGRALCRLLWDAYCDDDLFGRRMRLSELVGRKTGKARDKTPLLPEEEQELAALAGPDYFTVGDISQANPSCGRRYIDLRHPDFDAKARRWAVLMIIVRLLHDRYCAVDVGRRLRRPGGYDDDIDAAVEAPLSPADVYLALFPIAQTPVVLPWHAVSADPAGSWSRYIRELNLDFKQLLAGTDCKTSTPGERLILRMFAESVGAEHDDWGPSDWDRDLLAQNVLFAKTEADDDR